MNTPRNVVVFYDKNCIDGAASVSIIRDVMDKDPLVVSANYIPIDYSDLHRRTQLVFSYLRDGDEVYFLDTSPKNDTLEYFINPPKGYAKVKKLTIFEHHKSEVDRLMKFEKERMYMAFGGNSLSHEFILDSFKSAAAMMVWDYFHVDSHNMPPLLEWIGRMDVDNDLPSQRDKAIAAYIDSHPLNTTEALFATVKKLNKDFVRSENSIAARGMDILRDQINTINKTIVNNIRFTKREISPGRLEWFPLVSANVKNHGRIINDVLQEIAVKADCVMAGAWYEHESGKIMMSVRSWKKLDVGAAAEYMGATIGMKGSGGHGTSAVVLFDDLDQFARNVPRFTKEQMMEMRLRKGHYRPSFDGFSPIGAARLRNHLAH